MFNKIAFLCVNPWEKFLPPIFHGYIREYYQSALSQALLREDQFYCREKIEAYGETEASCKECLFEKNNKNIQLIYVQSARSETIRQVYAEADIVLVGLLACRKEFDKTFLSILPWKEKTLFLTDERVGDKKFLQQIKKEYKLSDSQVMDLKKLPSYLTEALSLQ